MHFPDLIQGLSEFDGPFDAFGLPAAGCDVLFANYPAGTRIDTHAHATRNVEVITESELILTEGGQQMGYGIGECCAVEVNEEHAANFEVTTSEIEFWFET